MCLALPIEGINMVVGNYLAHNRVWANVAPPYVITGVPVQLPSNTEVEKTTKVESEVKKKKR